MYGDALMFTKIHLWSNIDISHSWLKLEGKHIHDWTLKNATLSDVMVVNYFPVHTISTLYYETRFLECSALFMFLYLWVNYIIQYKIKNSLGHL